MTRLAPALVCALLAAPWPVSAQAPDPRTDFTTALGAFSLALDGSLGDERATIASALDEMRSALGQWDTQIRTYEAAMSADIATATPQLAARMHLALGGVYLDRHRVEAGLRELHAARELDPARADVQTLLGAAYSQITGDAAAALAAFRSAAALDAANTIRTYTLAQELVKRRLNDAAEAALRPVVTTEAVRAALQSRAPLTSPFVRLGLVPERAGVEPFFAPARYGQGFDRLQHGDYEGAIAAWRAAATGDPLVSDAGPHRDRVDRAAAAMRRGDVETAVEELTAAVAMVPDRAEPRRLLGRAFLVDQQYENAAASFADAIRLDPTDERARDGHAEALVGAERLADAGQALQDTLAALPGSGRSRYAIARLYQRQGRYDEAIREFEAAAAMAPLLGLNGIHAALGALHIVRQNFDAAAAAYTARVDVHPNDPAAHYDLGDVYLRQARHDAALAEFAIALRLNPEHSQAAAAIAQVYLRTQVYEPAAAAAGRALELDPAHTAARYVLGTALLRLGRADEGRKQLETFQRQQAEAATARTRMIQIEGLRRDATISAADGNAERTVALLRQVLALETSHAAHFDLALALLDAGQPAEAVEHFNAAARLNAPYDVHRYLAEAYAALGLVNDSNRERASYERIHREVLRRRSAGR